MNDDYLLNKEKEYIGKITNDLSKSTFGKIENISSVQIYIEDMPYYYYEDNKEEKKANPKAKSNYETAKDAAKQIHSKMKIVPVKTLQDAIDYLKKK